MGVNCYAPICDGTNGPMDGPAGTPCVLPEPEAVPKSDYVKGSQYMTTGNLTPRIPGEFETGETDIGNVIVWSATPPPAAATPPIDDH